MISLDTYYSSSQYKGTSGTNIGREGYVPQAQISESGNYLRGDGKWVDFGLANLTSTYTTVRSLSDSWEESASITPLQTASASWNSVYTTTNTNSGKWESVYTTVQGNSGNYILDGGNTKGANIVIGTNDQYHFSLETNNTRRATFLSGGSVVIGDYTTNSFNTNFTISDILIKGNNNKITAEVEKSNIFGNNNRIDATFGLGIWYATRNTNIFGSNNLIPTARDTLITGSQNYINTGDGSSLIVGENHYTDSSVTLHAGQNNINFGGGSFVVGRYNILGKRYLALSAESIGNDLYEVSFDQATYNELTVTTGSRGNTFSIGKTIGVNSISLASGLYNTFALIDSKDDATYKVYLSAVPGFYPPLQYSTSYGPYYLVVRESDYFFDYFSGKGMVIGGEHNYSQGMDGVVFGSYNTVFGNGCVALGTEGYHRENYSFTIGYQTSALGTYGYAEGRRTIADDYSHAEGQNSIAWGSYAHAENSSATLQPYSHSENSGIASTTSSHAEGSGKTGLICPYSYSSTTNLFTFAPDVSGNIGSLSPLQLMYGYSYTSSTHFYITVIDRNTETGAISAEFFKFNPNLGVNDTGYILSRGAAGLEIIDAHAEGKKTLASGTASHAEGEYTQALGRASHTEGQYTQAVGEASHAEGGYNSAYGDYSHAAGLSAAAMHDRTYIWHGNSTATALVSTTRTDQFMVSAVGGVYFPGNVGIGTDNNDNALTITGLISTLNDRTSKDWNSAYTTTNTNSALWASVYTNVNTNSANYILDGGNTKGADISVGTNDNFDLVFETNGTRKLVISNTGSISAGNNVSTSFNAGSATGNLSFAIGSGRAFGQRSFAQGNNSLASGSNSYAEGSNTIATGSSSHTEGTSVSATNTNSHGEGSGSRASGQQSHAEGTNTVASGTASHSEGQGTTSSGNRSHSEGTNTVSSGVNSHSEGSSTLASGTQSHTEGTSVSATNTNSHAEGQLTLASGINSHTEGRDTIASGTQSHAEGLRSVASGGNSHAEGRDVFAIGDGSHAEGNNTRAIGINAHAEGSDNIASGNYSHAAGRYAATAFDNTFIWHGNSTAIQQISTTRTDQFMVSAAGGVYFPGNVGIGTDNNTNALTVNGILSAGLPLRFPFAGAAPSNTSTPVTWLDVYVNDTLYKLPLYQ